jgi:hypothetical protein
LVFEWIIPHFAPAMFYIHHMSCISPQQTFGDAAISDLKEVSDKKLHAIEPSYEGIPTGILRRMGKAIRLGVGAGLPLLQKNTVDGIIIGTANGGMEDCIRFLNQIIDYNEGMLTPTNFVQSTTNAIAAQMGLLSNNKSYNSTHVHRGLAFENALLDAGMLLKENTRASYLVGGVDEISSYNYNIDNLAGWFKKETLLAKDMYTSGTEGSIAGEGAGMFLVNTKKENAMAGVTGLLLLHTVDVQTITEQLAHFLYKHVPTGEQVDLLLSGEDGDNRMIKYYVAVEQILEKTATIARFKHMFGEYATVSAAALWLACYILKEHSLPEHMIKRKNKQDAHKRILIYNNHKGRQHGFILVENAGL